MESLSFPVDLSDLQTKLNPLLQSLLASPAVQSAKPSSTADGVAILLFLLSALGYLTHGRVWDKPDPHHGIWFEKPQLADGASSGRAAVTRDIAQKLVEGDYQCVIFWGSQSGTSERFAETLGRECLSYFGIHALVADISDYDAESISKIESTHFAIFILSTYGEGDPSDNTAGLWDWIKQVKDKKTRVENLRYLAFGLGNSNYKYYNRVLDVVADALDNAGATTLMPRQKADDANGGTEEDFQAWKDDLFALFRQLGFEQKTVEYQPTIEIKFSGETNSDKDSSPATSLIHQQTSTQSGIVPLTIKSAHELFAGGDRNCIHMELDLGNHDIVYKTGDHIGIWPCNPEEEIERLLGALGAQARRNERFSVTSDNESVRPKIPSPTTLETAFRHHLEICAPVARKTVQEIAQFAPTPEAKALLLELGQKRECYEQLISGSHITLARLLQLASPSVPWTSLPFEFVMESLLSLQPRYYSISSSSVIAPRRIAVTALVVNKSIGDESTCTIHGLTSNYLLSASNVASNASVPTPSYQRMSEGQGLQGSKILAHVRKSKFKLPITSSTPLVLISAGTGFAPFRAFLQERAKLHAIGKPAGKILLFFGCRNKDDFIYREEIDKIQGELGDKLKIITAFSRDGPKTYVQDRVGEHASEVLELLDAGANMYICGKASMAREVDMKLEDAVSKAKGVGESEVKAWADSLKKRGKWKADVWG
ncbi:NADPH--hemoprotein reductase [Ascochyta rabiei]|uniref:NADPH--cytochrome P450 reductase n=1 Tax=Didymella rabiei TaxID=5454 RepID=A0A163DFU0_DIDRA|nr:NADPH--hemoprotein reductase [Ascochyta rabiei]KZM23130.1 FMN binding [Ascochyta rabiei]UPX17923.1 NADPH--hemoprotein reductase [Ascochyta rabiei]